MFSITNLAILEALNGSKSVNTAEEIKTYLEAISKGTDRYGCRIANHTPVLVKGGMIPLTETADPSTKSNGRYLGIQEKG
jgi:hypothetical protein